MAVPKQHKTKSRRNQRRMHIFLKEKGVNKCSKCGKSILSHTVCLNCGYYKGQEVIDTLKKLTKKEKKQKQREMVVKEKQDKKDKALGWEEMSKK